MNRKSFLRGKIGIALGAMILTVMMLMAACGGGGSSSTGSEDSGRPAGSADGPGENKLEKVTLRLHWVPTGNHVAFFLAHDRGYYRDAGLDVEIFDGNGSSNTVKTVGNNQDTFGFADMSVMALGAGKGIPLKAVAGMFQRNVFGIFSDKNLNITEPKDLEGHTLLHTPESVETALLPAFFKMTGVDPDKVQLRSVGAASKVTDYIAGQADMMSTDVPYASPAIDPKRPSNKMMFADYGLVMPCCGIFTTNSFLQSNPETVRSFVQASMKGLEEALAEPEAAVAAMAKYREGADQQILLEAWLLYKDFLESDRTKGKPLGWQSFEDWQEALIVLKENAGHEGSMNPDDYFTNEFIE